jgi:hypothetical protein
MAFALAGFLTGIIGGRFGVGGGEIFIRLLQGTSLAVLRGMSAHEMARRRPRGMMRAAISEVEACRAVLVVDRANIVPAGSG